MVMQWRPQSKTCSTCSKSTPTVKEWINHSSSSHLLINLLIKAFRAAPLIIKKRPELCLGEADLKTYYYYSLLTVQKAQ